MMMLLKLSVHGQSESDELTIQTIFQPLKDSRQGLIILNILEVLIWTPNHITLPHCCPGLLQYRESCVSQAEV
jgi:hypothetical protein